MQQNNIKDITLEAHKAYLFLFEYQSRILDLMNFIKSQYLLTYVGGYPMFSNSTPQQGTVSLDKWGWDWLNMYYYQFVFKYDGTEDRGKFLSVTSLNDTGYYDGLFNDSNREVCYGDLSLTKK